MPRGPAELRSGSLFAATLLGVGCALLACSGLQLAGGLEVGLRVVAVHAASPAGTPTPLPVGDLENPDRSCAGCHAAIYKQYERTAMARSSGLAADGLIPGSYFDPSSGVQYRVGRQGDEATLRFERVQPIPSEAAAAAGGMPAAEALRGGQSLVYFIGSGTRGRTFLFRRPLPAGGGALWFEAPVNWYTRQAHYGMAPAYEGAPRAPLALPVEPNCLHCHTTGVQPVVGMARNGWVGAPFRQGGVGCSACHGDGSEHVASGGRVALPTLLALSPSRQDSLCLQCHLEGDAVVQRAGRSLAQFHPGEEIGATAVYFVNASSPRTAGRATSQYEALLRSACRRAVGPRLRCLSCHDPHGDAPAGTPERVAEFRSKCLGCHTAPGFAAATHHPEQPDCARCHMPSRATTDISHEQVTDHDIELRPLEKEAAARRAATALARVAGAVALRPVGGDAAGAGARELGLAYVQFAERGDRAAFRRAMELLARSEADGTADAAVHGQMGFLQQIAGDTAAAEREYHLALQIDPANATTLTNLAVLEARGGHPAAAEHRLEEVARGDPAATAALLNLAAIQCALGHAADAGATVTTALRFNPDDARAQQAAATGACRR